MAIVRARAWVVFGVGGPAQVGDDLGPGVAVLAAGGQAELE
ncbi:hypothetical protein [Streptomyces kaniharaensis]|nr:hypothetical protein [Streptomyces kaniharaensis]